MLELTGVDIGKLNDADLRDLIGLLCEAELRLRNLPSVGVTFGGHQDAPDGGIDVRVEISEYDIGNGFLPRNKVGFQVKKPKMPHGEILKEMCPDGKLREVIQKLGREKGAYVIVSGKDSLTDVTRLRRRKSMREALKGFKEKKHLFTDFYDQSRIASWVRNHPSLVFWVREKIGNPIQGWQSYKNWSKRTEETNEPYFIDEGVRIYRNTKGLPIIEGINQMRKILSNPGTSVRLVGLSGVGKTRLLQALFDGRIGNAPLNQHQVIYADTGLTQNPPPEIFAEILVAQKQPIILAIDNCSDKLHYSLNSICSVPNSLVKLITIEYDIKEDQPETTQVFKLVPVSNQLIEKIIHYQFPKINSTNTRKIAEFSGGNARMAIALSRTMQEGESISYLKENDLFERLFYQRKTSNVSLMHSAEVCSLVYSFNIEMEEGKNEEMAILAKLASKTPLELYRDISTLEQRELVQKRNEWRAVLPHPISNRLASRALASIPLSLILSTFQNSTERVLKSFANRLSFLGNNEFAKEIAAKWLSQDGLLGNLNSFNAVTLDVFKKIALIYPSKTLETMERSVKNGLNYKNAFTQIQHVNEFAKIASALAYDKDLFERSLNVLTYFYVLDISSKERQNVKAIIETLFYINYSRTHTPIELRLKVVKKMLHSTVKDEKALGNYCLNALLRAKNIRPAHSFTYYERKYNDFGYVPRNSEEIKNWYSLVLKSCQELIIKANEENSPIKQAIAKNFDGLWAIAHHGFYELLEAIFEKCNEEEIWADGWIAVRKILRVNRGKMPDKKLKRLQLLEQKAAPKNINDQVQAYVLSSDDDLLALLEENSTGGKSLNTKILELGKLVGKNKENFNQLLPLIVKAKNYFNYKIEHFGKGLALSCNNPLETWNHLINQYVAPYKGYNNKILCGFLLGISERDIRLSDKILDNALSDDFLISIFPILQGSVENDPNRWKRIKKAIEIGKTPIWTFGRLNYANLTADYDQLYDILSLLSDQVGGLEKVIEFLWFSVFREPNMTKYPPSPRIKSFAQNTLTKINFSQDANLLNNLDIKLEKIILGCFDLSKSSQAKVLIEKIALAYKEYKISIGSFSKTIQSIAKVQPISFLDCFFGNNTSMVKDRVVVYDFDENENPFSLIDNEVTINWCDKQPINRYIRITPSINLFKYNEESNELELSDLAQQVMINSPNIEEILSVFGERFIPSSSSGSLVTILQKRLVIIDKLKSHPNEKIKTWAGNLEKVIKQKIYGYQEDEKRRINYRYERFEY